MGYLNSTTMWRDLYEIALIIIILGIISSIVILAKNIKNYEEPIGAVIFIFCISAFMIWLSGNSSLKVEETREYAKEMITKAGYETYLDGVEVDAENIDIDFYNCSVDDENKAVYLTHK